MQAETIATQTMSVTPAREGAGKPAYEPPSVATYTDAALLEALGPARAGGTYNLLGGP
jgi:hypothetical protein